MADECVSNVALAKAAIRIIRSRGRRRTREAECKTCIPYVYIRRPLYASRSIELHFRPSIQHILHRSFPLTHLHLFHHNMSGSCLCGAVTYTLSSPPLKRFICHCPNCQKFSGSAFMTNFWYPKDVNPPPKSPTLLPHIPHSPPPRRHKLSRPAPPPSKPTST